MNPSAGPTGSGPPPSFKTNVNRAKTKRWVEAKSYSYDGDDWGDADEYDEYGGYAAPGPGQKPAALQTGFRQPGQMPSPTGGVQGRQEIHQSPSPYSDQQYIAPGGKLSQLHDDQGPMGRQPYRQSGDGRMSTFNQGQDQRTYSMGSSHYRMSGAGPPGHAPFQQNYGQQQGPPQTRESGPGQAMYHQPTQDRSRQSLDGPSRTMGTGPPAANYRGVSYSDRQRLSRDGSRSQSMTSSTSSTDFHSRRDFSPSAMPPPLHTQPRDHPPRKSSLSQDETPRISGGPLPSSTTANPNPPDSSDALVSSPVESSGNVATANKPLPFVRPADIYRRLAEEREKERQSQESLRPSVDALSSSKAGPARDDSPSNPGLRPGFDNTRAVPARIPSFESGDDSEGGRRQKTSLDPVPERRSEYGMEAFTADNAPPKSEAVVQNDPQLPEAVKRASSSNEKPRLPPVPRMSGFGESFLSSLGDSHSNTPEAQADKPRTTGNSQDPAHLSPQTAHDTSLQHEPSLGFRSVVNKAFEDQIPPTPSSTAGSAIARSNSESTNGISPIISRAPSAVTSDARAREAETRDHGISIIPEEPNTNAPRRPDSGDTTVTLKDTARKSSPSRNSQPETSGSIPTPVISSHRWSVHASSPDNSPARTPVLETNLQPPQAQEAELAMTTPTSITHSNSSASNILPAVPTERSDQPSKAGVVTVTGGQEASHAPTSAPAGADSVNESPSTAHARSSIPQAMTPSVSRAESPSKGRVRDLADKFESQNVSRKGSESSLKGSVHSATMGKPDEYIPSRPPTDRMESFRPHLPGGWESYASNPPAPVPAPLDQSSILGTRRLLPDAQTSDANVEHSKSSLHQTTSTLRPNSLGNGEPESDSSEEVLGGGTEQTAAKHESIPPASEKYSLSDPFSAVAAAGTALAGALIAAVGIDQIESESREDPAHETPNIKTSAGRSRATSMQNSAIHPETMQPWVPSEDDSASSAAPTPLAVDSGHQVNEIDNPAYFPPIVPLKQKPREIQTTEDFLAYTRPPILPTLSTETSPNDYESDRLRKQLVRELSPHTERFPEYQTGERDPSHVDDTRPSDNLNRQESIYDSYLNEASSGEDIDPGLSYQDAGASTAPDFSKDRLVSEAQLPPAVEVQHSSTPAGLEPVPEAIRSDSLQVRPSQLTHRFSWEPVPEEINGPSHDTPPVDTSLIPGSKPAQQVDFHTGFMQPSAAYQPSNSNPQIAKELPDEPIDSDISSAQPIPAVPQQQQQQQQQQQEDDSVNLSSCAPAEPAIQDVPLPQLPNEQQKILAFREILALRTPAERIHTFKETREQFANMNTGLDRWILATLNDLPEHGELTKNGATFGNVSGHRPSPSRGKFPGLRVVSGQTQPQPYYQQYLNASTQAASSSPSTQGPTNATSSPTYSPASQGGRNSGHQMQAKGKDLLHTAGLIGGKANVAAKGLFSKGKSKFRGSGGADKATPRISSAPSSDATLGMQQQYPPSPKLQSQDSPLPGFLDRVDSDAPSTESPTKSLPQYFTDQVILSSSNEGPLESTQSNTVSISGAIIHLPQHSIGLASVTSGGFDSSEPPKDPSTVVDEVLSSLVDSPAAAHGSGVSPQSISPEVFQSPKSQSSSNRTPTQADFDPNGLTGELSSPPSPLPPFDTSNLSGSNNRANATVDTFSHPMPSLGHEDARDHFSQANNLSTSAEENTSLLPQDPLEDAQSSKDGQAPFVTAPRASEDSEATFHTADSGEEFQIRQQTGRAVAIPPRALPQPVRAIAVRTSMGRARNTVKSNQNDCTSQTTPGTKSTTPSGESENASRPFSFISFGQVPVGDLTLRGPSFDNGRVRLYKDLPMTPASSEQSVTYPQSQVAPAQHDANHDFTSRSGQSSERPRGRSFSRPFNDPDLHENPAFRKEHTEVDGNSLPASHYPAQARRGEAIISQGTEYQLDGIGPPTAEDINKSRARRSSRGSAFFKRLSFPSAPDVLPLPLPRDTEARPAESTSNLSTSQKKKAKRISLFRSLTGRSGTDSGRSSGISAAQPARARTDLQQYMDTIPTQQGQYPSPAGQTINQGSPVGPDSPASGKKLQRSSTSGVPEQKQGKKKRLSSLGTFLGRISPKQQSNFIPALQPKRSSQQQPLQPQPPFDELLATAERQRMGPTDPIVQGSAYQTNRQEYYQPVHPLGYDRAPLEGYYSPNNTEGIYPLDYANEQAPPTGYRQPQAQPHLALSRTSASPSPAGNLQSYPTQNNSQGGSGSYGNHLRTNGSISSNTSPQYQSYGRSGPVIQGRYQGPSYRSSSANPDAAYVDPIMRSPQGHHEAPMCRSSSPAPPPPPPKDDPVQKSPQYRALSHTRTSSQDAQVMQETPSPSPRGLVQTRQSLPPLQTGFTRMETSSGKPTTPEDVRKARQRQIEEAGPLPPTPTQTHRQRVSMLSNDADEEIVMSSTSYPGQEWQPSYRNWNGD